MSKVILLSGSPNKNGNTVQVLEECAKVIRSNDVDAEVISIAGMSIKDSMDEGNGYNDGLDEIIKKIKDAEGLILASPVYWGTARAEMMTVIQRIAKAAMKDGRFLARKIGGPIAIARRGGHTSTLQEMLMFYLYNDMIVPGSTYWNIVFGRNSGEALNDEEGMKTVKHFSGNVAFLVKKLYD